MGIGLLKLGNHLTPKRFVGVSEKVKHVHITWVTSKTLLESLQFGLAMAFQPLSSRVPRIGVFEFGFLAESLLEVKNCGPYLALQAFINAQEELSARKMWVQPCRLAKQ